MKKQNTEITVTKERELSESWAFTPIAKGDIVCLPDNRIAKVTRQTKGSHGTMVDVEYLDGECASVSVFDVHIADPTEIVKWKQTQGVK